MVVICKGKLIEIRLIRWQNVFASYKPDSIYLKIETFLRWRLIL